MPLQRPSSLKDWQQMFQTIYGEINKDLSPRDMWLHLMEEAGEVAKDMRKEDYRSLAHDIPDVFAWLCTFSNRAGIDLEGAVWEKYPRICPYCLREKHCVCIAEGYDTYDPERLTNYRNLNHKPRTCQEWSEMFSDIFGNVNRILSRASIGFHLMEEIGEVASMLRKGCHRDYSTEVADVFAWLIAIPMKMSELENLEDMTWDVYPGRCKVCHLESCGCEGKTTSPRI